MRRDAPQATRDASVSRDAGLYSGVSAVVCPLASWLVFDVELYEAAATSLAVSFELLTLARRLALEEFADRSAGLVGRLVCQ